LQVKKNREKSHPKKIARAACRPSPRKGRVRRAATWRSSTYMDQQNHWQDLDSGALRSTHNSERMAHWAVD